MAFIYKSRPFNSYVSENEAAYPNFDRQISATQEREIKLKQHGKLKIFNGMKITPTLNGVSVSEGSGIAGGLEFMASGSESITFDINASVDTYHLIYIEVNNNEVVAPTIPAATDRMISIKYMSSNNLDNMINGMIENIATVPGSGGALYQVPLGYVFAPAGTADFSDFMPVHLFSHALVAQQVSSGSNKWDIEFNRPLQNGDVIEIAMNVTVGAILVGFSGLAFLALDNTPTQMWGTNITTSTTGSLDFPNVGTNQFIVPHLSPNASTTVFGKFQVISGILSFEGRTHQMQNSHFTTTFAETGGSVLPVGKSKMSITLGSYAAQDGEIIITAVGDNLGIKEVVGYKITPSDLGGQNG